MSADRKPPRDWADHAAREASSTIVGQTSDREMRVAAIFRRRAAEAGLRLVAMATDENHSPIQGCWGAMTWLGKMVHNFPAWHANRLGVTTQWWDGTHWQDEAKTIPEYMLVNIEHPQRIKPGCTVQPVEIIFKEGGNASSVKTA